MQPLQSGLVHRFECLPQSMVRVLSTGWSQSAQLCSSALTRLTSSRLRCPFWLWEIVATVLTGYRMRVLLLGVGFDLIIAAIIATVMAMMRMPTQIAPIQLTISHGFMAAPVRLHALR